MQCEEDVVGRLWSSEYLYGERMGEAGYRGGHVVESSRVRVTSQSHTLRETSPGKGEDRNGLIMKLAGGEISALSDCCHVRVV
jgi:hypothetical protein